MGQRVLEVLVWWGHRENRSYKQLSKKAGPAYVIAGLTSLSACPLGVRNHLGSLAQPSGYFQTGQYPRKKCGIGHGAAFKPIC